MRAGCWNHCTTQKNGTFITFMNEHPYPLEGKALLTATTGKTLFSRILVECLHTILYLVNNRRSALLQFQKQPKIHTLWKYLFFFKIIFAFHDFLHSYWYQRRIFENKVFPIWNLMGMNECEFPRCFQSRSCNLIIEIWVLWILFMWNSTSLFGRVFRKCASKHP